MLTAWLVLMTMFVGQAKEVTLPDTPQGRHVEAWIRAFNSGDEKTFLQAQDALMAASVLGKRTPQERAQMFHRMQGDFGKLQVARVVKATPQQITIIVPTKEGDEGTFTFDFEEKAPFRISGIGIDVRGGSA
jgi:hypothetical protein